MSTYLNIVTEGTRFAETHPDAQLTAPADFGWVGGELTIDGMPAQEWYDAVFGDAWNE